MACSVEANGVTLNCACGGCGIAYNHSTKTYHILCCGSITTMTAAFQPAEPPRPGLLSVSIAGASMLQTAQLLDSAAPGTIRLPKALGVKALAKKVTMKGTLPTADLASRAGLEVARKR